MTFKMLFTTLTLASSISLAQAAGMVPDANMVLVDAGDGESSINVTNTDDQAALLYTSLVDIEHDTEPFLVVTPPITRVEAGERQLVRFIVQTDKPLTTQRLKRVIFEGIAQKNPGDQSTVGVTVRQNLPVIVHPKGLTKKSDPWTLLKWSRDGQNLNVSNDSPYVVRLSIQTHLMPGKTPVSLPTTYVLPGQTHRMPLPANSSSAKSVRIYPVNLYGFEVKPFDAVLN